MPEPSYFIFITMPQVTDSGASLSSQEVLESRLAENRWAVYSNTRNKHRLKSGDKVVFYTSNRKTGGEISAVAQIKEFNKPDKHRYYLEEHGVVEYFVSFEDITLFERTVGFKKLLRGFSFCPANIQKWGVVLMGGIRELNAADYKIIISNVK